MSAVEVKVVVIAATTGEANRLLRPSAFPAPGTSAINAVQARPLIGAQNLGQLITATLEGLVGAQVWITSTAWALDEICTVHRSSWFVPRRVLTRNTVRCEPSLRMVTS